MVFERLLYFGSQDQKNSCKLLKNGAQGQTLSPPAINRRRTGVASSVDNCIAKSVGRGTGDGRR